MKTKFILLFLSGLLLLSCSSNDESTTQADLLYGRWQLTKAYYGDGTALLLQPCSYKGYQEFLPDGKLVSFQACLNTTETYTYTVSGDQIESKAPQRGQNGTDLIGKIKIISLDAKKLILQEFWNSDDGSIPLEDRDTFEMSRLN